MKHDPIAIVAARRSPMGAFQGVLSPLAAPEISAAVTAACLEDCGIDPGHIDELLMGCVLSAGLGQAPARQAALGAGIPIGTACTTVNKICGSGMKTTMIGHDLIKADSVGIVVTGGMESMSNAPYLMPKARSGYRMGHQEVLDHMFIDGLQNPYDGNMMGHFAELTAEKYGYTRDQQDEFTVNSVTRARSAMSNGQFDAEIVPLTVKTRKGESRVNTDENPLRVDMDRIPTLRPAFKKDGTVTAASSSSIADGAATLILMRQSEAEKRGIPILATIAGHSGHAHEPEWFTTAPIFAVKRLHEKLGWDKDSVSLYEINEAFACVTMAATQDLGLDADKVNVNGGACALGHPIGASGARIIVTLLHALRNSGGGKGIASLCIGGGEAVAIGIEV